MEDQGIASLLAFKTLPEEEQKTLRNQVAALVEKRLLLRLINEIPPEKLPELQQLADKPDELVTALCGERDIAMLVQEELTALEKELAP